MTNDTKCQEHNSVVSCNLRVGHGIKVHKMSNEQIKFLPLKKCVFQRYSFLLFQFCLISTKALPARVDALLWNVLTWHDNLTMK